MLTVSQRHTGVSRRHVPYFSKTSCLYVFGVFTSFQRHERRPKTDLPFSWCFLLSAVLGTVSFVVPFNSFFVWMHKQGETRWDWWVGFVECCMCKGAWALETWDVRKNLLFATICFFEPMGSSAGWVFSWCNAWYNEVMVLGLGCLSTQMWWRVDVNFSLVNVVGWCCCHWLIGWGFFEGLELLGFTQKQLFLTRQRDGGVVLTLYRWGEIWTMRTFPWQFWTIVSICDQLAWERACMMLEWYGPILKTDIPRYAFWQYVAASVLQGRCGWYLWLNLVRDASRTKLLSRHHLLHLGLISSTWAVRLTVFIVGEMLSSKGYPGQ